MSTHALSASDKRIYEVAEEYKHKGYKVTIAPSPKQLPEFLRDYEPDLVAEGPDDSVVVEFKSRGKDSEVENWGELARTIQQHPGWRLELVVGGEQHQETPATIDQHEIERRLRDGQRLAEEQMLDAALLITWTATEAAMRLACQKQRIELPDFRPATLITRLYTDGVIEREEYDLLTQYMRARNAVAHGFRTDTFDASSIEQLRRITLRLLRLS